MVIAVVHSDSKLGGEYKGKRQGINVCMPFFLLFYYFTTDYAHHHIIRLVFV